MSKQRPVTRHRIATVRARLDEMTGEIPSSDGGGGKGSHSDRTSSLAFTFDIDPNHPDHGHRADVARRDSQRLDQLEYDIMRRRRLDLPVAGLVSQLDVLLSKWEPLTDAQVEGLRSKGDDSGAGWCQSHWRVGTHEPPRTVGSRLCRWCEDWVRALTNPDGEWAMELDMPPVNMVALHAQGRRIDPALPPRRKVATRPSVD